MQPGTELGRYLVLERLGEGGMGVVYAARDRELSRDVALKLLRERAGEGDRGARRLVSEAQAMARLSHPNVLPVFDVGAHEGQVFVAMELSRGGTLRQRLARTRPGWREIVGLFLLAGRGLEAAHRAGIVHRDFKPDNVLVDEDGRVRVTDFGLARALPAAPGPGTPAEPHQTTLAGTLAYMSPEQHQLRPAEPASDQFAYCVALWEALFGELPFGEGVSSTSETPVALALDVIQGRLRPPPPRSRVPRGVRRVLRRGLSVEPADRFPSMGALLAALEREAAPPLRARWLALALVVVAAAAIVWAVKSRAPEAPVVEVLTTGEETVAEPAAFVPGGLVIASDRTGSRQLWWVAEDGRQQRQLTGGQASVSWPHVQGEHLYYLEGIGAERNRLVRVPLTALAGRLGDPEVVLTGVGTALAGPGGRILATETRLTVWGGPHAVDEVDASGKQRRLFDGAADGREVRWIAWSPGGRVAIMTRVPADYHEGEVILLGGERRTLARGLASGGGLAWSDEDTLVAFRGDGEERRLVAFAADGGDERVVVARARGAMLPAVAADGRMAYLEDSTDSGLWLADGGPLRRITFAGGETASSPSWVPARAEVAYLADRGGRFEIVRVGGPDLDQVVGRQAIVAPSSSVAVSPDGTQAAYGTYRGDEAVLEVVALEAGATPRALVRAPRPALFLTPQFLGGGRIGFVRKDGPDGASSRWEVAPGAAPRRLGDGYNGIRSPDERWVVLGRPGTMHRMDLVPLDAAGQPAGPPVALPADEMHRNARFTAAGELLVVSDELFAVDPATGRRRDVVGFPPGTRDVEVCVEAAPPRIVCAISVGRTALVLLR